MCEILFNAKRKDNCDCIPYITNLCKEIEILQELKNKKNSNEVNILIKNKERTLTACKKQLSSMSDNQICYRLYLKILNGINPSKAVEEVAEENYQKGIRPCSVGHIWDKYYRKLKKILEK